MTAEPMPELVRARWLLTFAAAASLVAVPLGHWRTAIGFAVGVLSMSGALELARLRAAALQTAARTRLMRLAHGLLQIGKYIVAIAVFWVTLNVLRVPLWALCAGVTAGVACLLAGFLSARAGQRVHIRERE